MANPPPEPDLLRPYGDTGKGVANNWFRVKFRFTREDILKWMKDVASEKNANCPPEELRTDDHFKFLLKIYEQLESLATGGENYENPGGPQKRKCHIYRELNPGYGPKQTQSKDVSDFLVKSWTNNYDSGPDVRNINLNYWCIYDLIGLFLSLLGSAPPAADRNNYFLPLTAVYARWCSRLAGKLKNKASQAPSDPGVGPIPMMFQCTWRDRKDGKGKWFFLGASLGGDQFADNPSGADWQMKVQMERFRILRQHQQTVMVRDGDFNSTEPEKTLPDGTGNLWGNCAETYPFVQCMDAFDVINSNQNVQGLALSKLFIDQKKPVTDYSGYADDLIWKSVRPPCRNCGDILRRVQANQDLFAQAFEMDRAPLRNPPAPPQDAEVEEGFVIRDMKEPLIQEMVEVTSN
ncbi:hypothetical protein CFAM422_010410 [Trichoderma lentiforme]|uniref:Uncharacterized protein n=1 Tax=Trichoderma lentiforme TaxID=1567552 RepID=A0A9P4X7M6_9HYPO|nr:hypothetical protein CFAM422_010410 [Trichoderma lentiforme]